VVAEASQAIDLADPKRPEPGRDDDRYERSALVRRVLIAKVANVQPR